MTTLFLWDSVEKLPSFIVSLNGVALNRRVVETSIACVESFVRSPRFTQRGFFSNNGISLLVSAANAVGSIRDQSTCEPWVNVLPEGYEATVVDLRKAYDAVVVRRKKERDTSERWLGVHSVVSSEVGEPPCQTAVRISEVEVGMVENLSECVLAGDQPCSNGVTMLARSLGKGKKCKRSATPAPVASPKKIFQFDDEWNILPKWRGG